MIKDGVEKVGGKKTLSKHRHADMTYADMICISKAAQMGLKKLKGSISFSASNQGAREIMQCLEILFDQI